MNPMVLSAREAAYMIKDGSTLTLDGFSMFCVADELCYELEQRFLTTGHPRDLTLLSGTANGDKGERGANRFAHEGLLKRIITGHWKLMPKLQQLAVNNLVEAYNFPQGVIVQLFREIAAKRPGLITKIGLHTFVDPRISGGKISERTKDDLVELTTIDGEEYLRYKPLHIDYAFLRGTTADPFGNISIEHEGYNPEAMALSAACRNCGGQVFVQVERLSDEPINAQQVHIPGLFVTGIVPVSDKEKFHLQSAMEVFDPAKCGIAQKELTFESLPMNERKIIARRAAMELEEGAIVNLGIGIPEGIGQVAYEQGRFNDFTLTVESGVIGGLPLGGIDFGGAINPKALIPQDAQFAFYHGGGLDMSFLGFAQCDAAGNVNVSKFGTMIAGCGGFICITQTCQKIFFCGTFTSGGLRVKTGDGKLSIRQEGTIRKFCRQIEQITFSSRSLNGRTLLFIMERAVFRCTEEDGLILEEIAPGVELERDILGQMEFMPKISPNLKGMDPAIFWL